MIESELCYAQHEFSQLGKRVSLKNPHLTGLSPSLMTRSAVLNGPSLHRQRKDVTGTRTQSSSPVSGPLLDALIFVIGFEGVLKIKLNET